MNLPLLLLTLCQGLLLTNNITFIAINGLVGLALAPQPWMATLPVCGYVAGGALFAPLVARHQRQWGRRRGFQLGALVAIVSCALAAWAVNERSFWGVVLATVIAGYYNASAGLFRFAATELVPPAKRETAISWVLAGGLLGAVVGPALARYSRDLLVQPFAGAYLVLIGVGVLSLCVVSLISFPPLAESQPGAATGRPWRQIAREEPLFLVAMAACALGYGVMNLLMAATPIAMKQCSLPFDNATLVLQWHVLGMFVPSFFTGSLIKRFGALPVMAVGLLLNLACVAFALAGQDLTHFLGALLTLGVGWNFLFVGGTTLFTETYRPEEKTRAQAAMDMAIYGTMTFTAFSSGALVTTGGWQWMNLGSLVPLAVAGVALAVGARRLSRQRGACPVPTP